jgi:flagellar motor protein MotB
VAAKGGGAWKVAYADFVTAMMAFFLVMWICGQDQSIRRAVSFYFNDPFNSSHIGFSRESKRAGSVRQQADTGNVPLEENVALGRGRNPYLSREPNSVCTKLVSDWIHSDSDVSRYWHEQARRQRDLARWSLQGDDKVEKAETVAVRELARQLKAELKHGIPAGLKKPFGDLLLEAVVEVNWEEIAEDLLPR